MRFRRLGSALLAAVLAAGAVGCADAGPESRCTTVDGVLTCEPGSRTAAPHVVGDLLAGGRYDLADQRGQVVVVNFWGSWCAPCRAEIEDMEQVFQATRAQGVAFLGINIRDERDKARAFEKGRVTYPSVFDPSSRLALDFDISPNALPVTVVLDRDGRIARMIRTPVRRAVLQPIVAEVAAEDDGR